MLDGVEERGDAEAWVKDGLDRGDRLMGFGHRVYRAEDPRARVLRRTARDIGAPRLEVAEALEEAALAELQARKPDRVLATNVEFWSAVVLDFADVPAGPVHPAVLVRAGGRLGGPHPRAEARGAADPARRQVRGPGPALGRTRCPSRGRWRRPPPSRPSRRSRASPRFAKSLFLGEIHEELVFPFPKPDEERAGARSARCARQCASWRRDDRPARDRGGALDRRRHDRASWASAG